MRKLVTLLAVLSASSNVSGAGYPVFKTLRQYTYHVDGGTAFLTTYRDKTYMVTNWHVCRNFKTATVNNEERGFTTRTEVLKAFPDQDLCLLKTEEKSGIKVGKDLPLFYPIYIAGYPQYAHTLQLRKGKTVYLGPETLDFGTDRGCPPSFDLKADSDPKKKKFEVRCEHTQTIMDTTAEGTHGNSGSPVINAKGQLVGIVHSSDTGPCEDKRTCKLNYIPVSTLISILDSL